MKELGNTTAQRSERADASRSLHATCATSPVNRLATLLAASLLATGCVPLSDSDACSEDSDCGDDEICSDISECATPEQAPGWRIRWTINGQQPTPSAPELCAAIDELELAVSSTQESLQFAPLNCASGQFSFRSIPLSFSNARITAFDENGFRLSQARQFDARGENEAALNLVFVTP